MGYSWSQQDESVGAGFLRIASEQIAKAVLNADAVDGPPADRIHSARRHCKRLRGLFRLVRSDFPAYRRANASVRDAARGLAAVRDAAVLCDTLERLYAWAGHPAPENLDRHRATPEAEAATLATFRKDMTDIMAEAASWKLGRIDLQTLVRGVKQTYGRAADAADHSREKPSDETFHAWRKLVKYHSFHLILLKSCLGDDEVTELERVEHLAELLGRHHDLAVLRETARTTPDALGGHLDEQFIEANASLLQSHLEARAFALANQIFVRPPRIVQQSVKARWTAWWHPLAQPEPA